MELDEIKLKYLNLGSLFTKVLQNENLNTQDKLLKFFDINDTNEILDIKCTRIIADSEFIVLKEALTPSENGPMITYVVLATSNIIRKGSQHFYSLNDTHLIPTNLLRVAGNFNVLHATLKITIGKKIKYVYYGDKFVLSL